MNERLPGSHLVAMTASECLARLGSGSHVGRIAFADSDRILIIPINYLLDESTVVFRTYEYSLLNKLEGADVAFEVDNHRPLEHSGWSVLVQGRVKRLIEGPQLERLRRGRLRAWAWQSADVWLGIDITDISGRVIGEPE